MVRVKTNRKRPKPEPAPSTRIGRAGRLLRQRARVWVSLAVVGLLGWGMHSVWQHVEPRISQRENYLLTAERITTTPLPKWIASDVRTEAIHNAALDGRLSVLDDAFAKVVEDAFALHPWVESVDRITKSYPAGAHVDLTYRKPVAVVELVAENVVHLVPIDRHGIHLPEADVPNMVKRYLPRIGGIVDRPPVGQPWADARVIGAAELAEQLSPQWQSLHLVDILPSARPEYRDDLKYFVFDLITSGGTRVVWGAAPGMAPPTEDAFTAKLQRLRTCAQQHGPLDSVRGPAVVDVRSQLAITPRTVKKPSPRTAKKPEADETKAAVAK